MSTPHIDVPAVPTCNKHRSDQDPPLPLPGLATRRTVTGDHAGENIELSQGADKKLSRKKAGHKKLSRKKSGFQ